MKDCCYSHIYSVPFLRPLWDAKKALGLKFHQTGKLFSELPIVLHVSFIEYDCGIV